MDGLLFAELAILLAIPALVLCGITVCALLALADRWGR